MKKIYSEKYLERALCDMVKKAGGLCIKLLCHQFLGLPDRLCLFPGGRLCFAEIKTTGKKPTKAQLHVHNILRNLGFMVFVIDSLEALNAFYVANNIQRYENDKNI